MGKRMRARWRACRERREKRELTESVTWPNWEKASRRVSSEVFQDRFLEREKIS